MVLMKALTHQHVEQRQEETDGHEEFVDSPGTTCFVQEPILTKSHSRLTSFIFLEGLLQKQNCSKPVNNRIFCIFAWTMDGSVRYSERT
jgi:hypothetical protein